ncbi:MAG: acyl-CoA desaturase [Telluria sp.]
MHVPPGFRTIDTPPGGAGNVLHGRVRYSPVKSLWLVSMASIALVGGILTFSWAAAGVFAAVTACVLLLGHSLGSHRKLIHNSFDCPVWLEYLLVYLGVQVGLSGPLGLLRQHDLRDYAQRQNDCHPYLRHGRSFLGDGWWQLHCELVLDAPPQIDLPPALARDRFYLWLERTWMLQQLPPAALLYLAGGWPFVIWGVCARITAGVTGHWLIGYFAHNHGGMHNSIEGAAVQGRNIGWTSLLTMGESWHNNHHAYPASARLGLYAGEWDPGWWMLTLLRKLGLVTRVTLPADLPPRPERHALDAPAHMPAMPAAPASAWPAAIQAVSAILRGKPTMTLRAPCVNLAPQRLAALCGPDVAVHHVQGLRRLELAIGETVVRGVSAVLLGVATRGTAAAVAALALLPLALAVEAVRASVDTTTA